MSDRRTYYFRQKVTEDELNQGFATLEQADRNMMSDMAKLGILSGLGVAQHTILNLSVDVGAGTAYDQNGQRMRVPSNQTLDLSVDSNAVSTAVSNANSGGNERYVSIFLQFDRALSDPRTDGNSVQIYFVENETFKWVVNAGAEAPIGTAVRPTLMSNAVLLADVKLVFGQTTIVNANISTTRRQDAVVVAGSPLSIRNGTVEGALSDVVAAINGLLTGTGSHLAAAFVDYAGGGAWRHGGTNPAASAEAQFDKIITDLTSQTSSSSGAEAIGCASIPDSISGSLGVGTVYSMLTNLRNSSFIDWSGTSAWANGTANPASNVNNTLTMIVNNLSSTSSTSGADYLGVRARTTWLGGRTNPSGTLYAAIDKIITDLASTTASDDGAERIGVQARSAWLNGVTNGATDLFSALNKIVNDLAGAGSGTDGAGMLGFFPAGNISSTNVRAAILELDNEKGGLGTTNAWTGANTFDNIGLSTGNHYKLNSPVISRVQQGPMKDSSGLVSYPDNSFETKPKAIAGGGIIQPLLIPHGATLNGVSIRVLPANGTIVGVTLPVLKVFKTDMTTGVATQIGGDFPDGSGSLGAFNTPHDISAVSLVENINRTLYFYWVQLSGQTGGGGAVDTPCLAARTTYTAPNIDDGY